MKSNLALAIRTRRQAKALTIEALAFAAGCSVSTVNRIEANTGSPTVDTLEAIARALDTTAADLLGAQVTS